MAETPTPEAVAAQSVVILGYCSTHPGVPFIEDMADHTAFCPLCEYLGTRRALTEQAREIERATWEAADKAIEHLHDMFCVLDNCSGCWDDELETDWPILAEKIRARAAAQGGSDG